MSYNSIYRGKILLNEDPKNLGRCKILVPSIHGYSKNITPNLLPWARPVSMLPVNENSGSYCLPEVGDIVWVFFEGGDLDSPIYFGGAYSLQDIPINPNEVMIYRNSGDMISYNKSTHVFNIRVGSSNLEVSGDSIDISSGTVTIKSGKIELDSDVTVAGNLNIQGNLNISGTCNRECKMSHE